MRKHLFLLISLLLCLPFAHATHLMGGEITAKQISGADYEVTLTTYRDTLGIPMAQTVNFDVKDVTGNTVLSFSQSQDTALSGGLLAGYPYGVEVYVFKDTITLPGIGTYFISFTNCCRNGAIQNLSAPLNESMYLETMVSYFGVAGANSTPTFLVQPVIFLPANLPWQYNPLPFDADGDSLVWSIDTSLNGFGSQVAGYTTPPGAANNAFSIDPVTGTISWTATQLGNFNASVLVEEFRNGGKIGEIRRDMQFIVVAPGGNFLPEFDNFSTIPVNPNGYPFLDIKAGQGYNLRLLASDPNPNDILSLSAYGMPFLFEQNQATFVTSQTGNGNEVQGLFEWYPDVSMVRDDPYIVVFRVWDHQFAFDEAVLMKVSLDNTAIDDPIDLAIGQVYPNPAKGSMYIPVSVETASDLTFTVYSYTGARVKVLGTDHYAAGNHIVKTNLDIAPGAYFLAVEQDGKLVQAQKFMVTE